MPDVQPLHRLFGLSMMDFFQGTDVDVQVEIDLSLKQQFLDVVLIRKGPAPIHMPDKLKEFVRQTIDEIFANMPLEERLRRLTIEERLKGLPAEERFKGLTAEEIVRALPPEIRDAVIRQHKVDQPPE